MVRIYCIWPTYSSTLVKVWTCMVKLIFYKIERPIHTDLFFQTYSFIKMKDLYIPIFSSKVFHNHHVLEPKGQDAHRVTCSGRNWLLSPASYSVPGDRPRDLAAISSQDLPGCELTTGHSWRLPILYVQYNWPMWPIHINTFDWLTCRL